MDKKQKAVKIMKITGTIIYIAVTVFLLLALLITLPDIVGEKDFGQALGGVIMLVITLIASGVYIIPVIMGGVGIAISSKIQDKKSKIYFVFMVLVPIITAIINFVTYFVLLNS